MKCQSQALFRNRLWNRDTQYCSYQPTQRPHNSSVPSTAYMRKWIDSALVEIMACRLFDAKQLSKPILGYCQMDHEEQTLEKFNEDKTFRVRKHIWKDRLRNGGHFVQRRWVNKGTNGGGCLVYMKQWQLLEVPMGSTDVVIAIEWVDITLYIWFTSTATDKGAATSREILSTFWMMLLGQPLNRQMHSEQKHVTFMWQYWTVIK